MKYLCKCGFEMAVVPQYGTEIVSVYHLHEHRRLDGHADAVRMEPVRSVASESTGAGAGILTSMAAP